MTDRFDMVVEKCKEVAKKAKSLYGISLDPLYVEFKSLGRTCGTALYVPNGDEKFNIEFNRDKILGDGLDVILNDTIQHEIAHLICDVNPTLGRGHNLEWKKVCKELGGSGNALDMSDTTIYYKHGTFRYTSILGKTYDFSLIRHNRIQQGKWAYEFKGGDVIDNTCKFEEI